VSNPNSKPPKAPVSVALISFELSCIRYSLNSIQLEFYLPGSA